MAAEQALFDFHFTAVGTAQEAADKIIGHTLDEQQVRYDTLITPNAYILVQYSQPENKWLKDFYKNSAFIMPDGMPIIWLSKLLKRGGLAHRVPGSDIFPALWQRIKAQQIPVSMVLPNDDIAGKFQQDYSRCHIAIPAFFQPADDGYIRTFAATVADGIVSNGSRFVFLGLTTPKQDILGVRIIECLQQRKYPHSVMILLLGASFEFYFGMKKRAPAFVQKSGFEWLYRLAKEPRRLWKRYTVDNIRFMMLALKEVLK